MASAAAEQEPARGSVPLVMGRGMAEALMGARRDRPPPPHRMARVGRQADSHRPCRGADDWEGRAANPLHRSLLIASTSPLPASRKASFRWHR